MLRTARLLTLTLPTGRQVMTHFIQCNALHTASTYNITVAVGYMLHGSLILPGQDFHLQAYTSFAGHTSLRYVQLPCHLAKLNGNTIDHLLLLANIQISPPSLKPPNLIANENHLFILLSRFNLTYFDIFHNISSSECKHQ